MCTCKPHGAFLAKVSMKSLTSPLPAQEVWSVNNVPAAGCLYWYLMIMIQHNWYFTLSKTSSVGGHGHAVTAVTAVLVQIMCNEITKDLCVFLA